MKKNKLALFSAPYVLWMAVFVVIPILMIVVYAFSSSGGGFTLENFARIGDYMVVFTRSFKLAFIATAICLLLGYPVSCFLAREGPRFQRVAMMLIMLPMWMNFLLRTYAWMSLLENTGLLNRFFEAIGLFDLINGIFGTNLEYFKMINTQGAVVLGMVYNFLPFMILPIYSVIVKLDHRLIEAARDLGADSATVFRRVTLPLSLPGVLSGITMVFVHLRHLPATGRRQAAPAGQPHRNAVQGNGLQPPVGLRRCPGDDAGGGGLYDCDESLR